jgi:hypothetical protein
MALLQINADWRIKIDPYNCTLQQKTIAKETDEAIENEEPGWRVAGYYSSLPDAVQALVRKEIRIPPDIRGIMERLDDLYRLINERFSNVTIVYEPKKSKKEKEAEED